MPCADALGDDILLISNARGRFRDIRAVFFSPVPFCAVHGRHFFQWCSAQFLISRQGRAQ